MTTSTSTSTPETTSARAPSTEWREVVAPDEATRFAEYGAAFVALQRAKSAKHGVGRALHRKPHLGLAGTFEVLEGLPAHARHGLFATPGTYEAWIRLSNGAAASESDSKPDARGFAFKVRGLAERPGALGFPVTSQDFALIQHAAFGFANSAAFVPLALAASTSPFAAVKHLMGRHGFVGGLREGGRIAKTLGTPFLGFPAGTFYSAAPIACGPYAVRVRLASREPAPANTKPPKNLADQMRARLATGPLVYDLALQFFVDEAITPIEDATNAWPESESPFVTVARLTLAAIPASPENEAALEALGATIEGATFDPWGALAEHRPLGDVMRARKVVYFESQKERGAQ